MSLALARTLRLLRAASLRRAMSTAAVAQMPALASLKCLYGSQTGTAMGFANQLADDLQGTSVSAGAEDLYEYDPAKIASEDAAVFVVSCFGRGEPTDSAKKFLSFVMSDSAPRLDKLRYSVFGLGSSQTHKEYYNVVGRKLDARLEALGATRIFPRGEGDDSGCIEMDFEGWKGDFISAIKAAQAQKEAEEAKKTAASAAAAAAAAAASAAATAAAPKPLFAPTSYARRNPYHMDGDTTCPLRVNAEAAPCDMSPTGEPAPRKDAVRCPPLSREARSALTANEPQLGNNPPLSSLRVTRKANLTPNDARPIYELTLKADSAFGGRSSLPIYATGDHVAVMPENSDEDVFRLCDRLGYDPAYRFSVSAEGKGAKLPFADRTDVVTALRLRVDFSGPVSTQLLKHLAASATVPYEAAELRALSERSAYIENVRNRFMRLPDLLNKFPSTHLPLDRLLATLPPLLPRFYSISSPQEASNDDELCVTFRHLKQLKPDGTSFAGLCSSFLSTRMAGDRVRVAVRPSSFRLPADASKPVVMIAGGIGIAPFRAFLLERIAAAKEVGAGAMSPALIMYGCRDADDEVYRGLMQQAVDVGAITTYDIGHAKAGRLASKVMLDNIDFITKALDAGGHFYICGGAAGYGQAVANTMKEILALHHKTDAAGAEAKMSELLAADRFIEDLAD